VIRFGSDESDGPATSQLDALEKLLAGMTPASEADDAAGFIWRREAIDRLELQLAVSPSHTTDQAERASALRERAVALSHRLHELNAVFVEGLRHDIMTGRRLRHDLLSELQRCCTAPPANETDANLGYDSLDVLVAGILAANCTLDDDPALIVPEMIPYQPTPARVILEILKQTELVPDDVFVDVGSGLGVVATLVSLLSGAASIGIEIQPSYCRYADESVRSLNLSNARFVCQDARQADFSTGTVFYMYTPFRGAMLQQVLERLHAEARRRRIRLCTYGPIVSEAVQQPAWPAFERSPLGKGPVTVFHSKPA
jgi:Histone methylation protein DOT1